MRIPLVMIGILGLLGCGGESGQETTILRFQGTVHSAVGQAPISPAQVILQFSAGAFGRGTVWAHTDPEGRYTLEKDFDGDSFQCISFGITAQAAGYAPEFVQPDEIECVPEVQTFNFELQPE